MDIQKIFFDEPPVKGERLTIRGLGFREEMPPSICNRPAGTGDYLFMYYYDPVIAADSRSEELREPGFLYIWEPGDMQYYGNPGAGYLHTWMHCDGTFVRKMISTGRLPVRAPIYEADPAQMESFVAEAYSELTAFGKPDHRIVENVMENWTRRLGRSISSEQNSSEVPRKFSEIGTYIDSNFAKQVNLEELAARAHLSVPHFCSEFKKHFGTSAIDYLIRQRLNHAVYLLHDINLSITDIAERVGYDDLYYFSKLFKKHMGVSPNGMRKKMTSGSAN